MSKKPKSRHALKDRHYKAIAQMIEGIPDAQIARNLKIAPETVCRWKNQNELFKAELERQRSEVLEILRDKQIQLAFRALDEIASAMDYSGGKIAVEYLKLFNKRYLSQLKDANEEEAQKGSSLNIKDGD